MTFDPRSKADRDRMREVAQMATDGPWTYRITDEMNKRYHQLIAVDPGVISPTDDIGLVDAYYIETFDPPLVIALLDALDEMEQE